MELLLVASKKCSGGKSSLPVNILNVFMRSPLLPFISKFVISHLLYLSLQLTFPRPLIILVALLCTLSKVSISFFKWGFHTCMQNSRWGLTNALYSLNMIFFSLLSTFLFIIPNTPFAPLAASAHCIVDLPLLSCHNHSQISFLFWLV